ncbi:MAG: hypothetical protein DI533_17045 [Cereibacter sphaeroides]|uniref:histidine kinase n=1 Tax=Cereibacter sphaeroides TaxID=1063 RepID=A0A2W5S7U2_CERSP|nr:MAG: hypothetical protein DI533_17045 [Cereibacter sphaeroides]
MESARSVVGSAIGLLSVAFLVLLFIVGLTFWLGERARSSFDMTTHARDIRIAAVGLRTSLQAAESSQRGYLVTGNEVYLAPFSTAKAEALRLLPELSQRLPPESKPALDRLVVLVDQKVSEMDQTIELKRQRQDEELKALLRSNRGKALMDEANVFLSAFIRSADNLVAEEVVSQREGFDLLRTATLAAALLILFLTVLVVRLIARFISDLNRSRAETSALNTHLEKRVAERTEQLSQSRDRAEMLLAEVNHRVANSLAMVASLVGLQSRGAVSEETKELLAETQRRISAVSLVHKKLYTSNDVRVVSLDEYLPSLLDQLELSLRQDGHGAALRQVIEPMKLPTDQSVSLGIIATEWVTNAFKYAYPDGSGEIRVKLRSGQGGAAELVVEDDGIGRSEAEVVRGTGLGTKLVTAMAASLGAKVEYASRNPGTAARLILPLH